MRGSPLDAAGVPVFQVALATSTRSAWAEAPRGLSPADLAMHVVLPEVDGRLFAGVASFKQPAARDPHLQFSRFVHQPDADRIEAIAGRVAAWHRLAATPAANSAPGAGAVDLSRARLEHGACRGPRCAGLGRGDPGRPRGAGYATGGAPLAERPARGARILWPMAITRPRWRPCRRPCATILHTAWGAPETTRRHRRRLRLPGLRRGQALVALQPERGTPDARDADYHDLARVPRHAYVAFYLWLQSQADALVHVGAHGTLEWLPGKSVALSSGRAGPRRWSATCR